MKIQFGSVVALALFVLCGCATVDKPKAPDVAIDDFMREYLGVQFGDDIAKINGFGDGQYVLQMKKKFQYFDHVCGYYKKGKLYRVNIWADIGKEYSKVSADGKLEKSFSDIAETMGLPSAYFAEHRACYVCRSPAGNQVVWDCVYDHSSQTIKLPYVVKSGDMEWPYTWRYLIDLVDTKLEKSLNSNKVPAPKYKTPVTDEMRKSRGVPLPDAE